MSPAKSSTWQFKDNEVVFDMANGCVCCTVRGDLIEIFKRIQRRKDKFDHIIVETTGMADPAPVCQTFFVDEGVRSFARIDAGEHTIRVSHGLYTVAARHMGECGNLGESVGTDCERKWADGPLAEVPGAVVTVVDALHILQHLDEDKPEGIENESVEQIAFADRVLLNKIDLVTPDALLQVERRIRAINAGVPIIPTRLRPEDPTAQPTLDLDAILGVDAFSLPKILESEPDFLTEEGQAHQHDQSVGSVGFRLLGEMNVGRLRAWIGTLLQDKGPDLFRYKVRSRPPGMARTRMSAPYRHSTAE
jgi:G3E family GTPase